jgi:hypothetical protein
MINKNLVKADFPGSSEERTYQADRLTDERLTQQGNKFSGVRWELWALRLELYTELFEGLNGIRQNKTI